MPALARQADEAPAPGAASRRLGSREGWPLPGGGRGGAKRSAEPDAALPKRGRKQRKFAEDAAPGSGAAGADAARRKKGAARHDGAGRWAQGAESIGFR